MTRVKFVLAAVLAAALILPMAAPATALELDRRRMLNAAEHKPWRGVGRVNVGRYQERSMCTGTLIGEDIVLTAAHCVVNPYSGKPYRVSDVHFVAGYRRGVKIAHSEARAIAVHPGYKVGNMGPIDRIGNDIALIRLKKPIPEAKAPHFGVGPAPTAETALTLISYRSDRAHALTRQRGCGMVAMEGAVIQLGCSVIQGASGSPIFMNETDDPRIVAVLAAKSRDDTNPIAFAAIVEDALADLLAALE